MVHIRFAKAEDEAAWFCLDRHLPPGGYQNKVRDRQAYVALEQDRVVGVLRYNLFWDSIPFCTMLFIDADRRSRGYGRALMEHWETDMRTAGYDLVLISTQADESAQHFYRKLGYRDCGGLFIGLPGYEDPMELFLVKPL